jgi:phosphoheptose isomerase
MTMLERLQQHAQDHHAAITTLSNEQGEAIVRAAQLLVEALVQEHRIFCAGLDGCSANAQSFVHKLIHHFEHERPALPALALAGDSGFGVGEQAQELFARPFQALSQAGDVLVVLSTASSSAPLAQLIRVAQERPCPVVAIASHGGGEITHLLKPQDVLIVLPTPSVARAHELQLFVLHCFCDLIDQALFGAHDA